MRSSFDTTYEQILLNRDHVDFERHTEGRDKAQWIYFAQLVSKEAAFGDYVLSRADEIAPVRMEEFPDIGERQAGLFLDLMGEFGLLKVKGK